LAPKLAIRNEQLATGTSLIRYNPKLVSFYCGRL